MATSPQSARPYSSFTTHSVRLARVWLWVNRGHS